MSFDPKYKTQLLLIEEIKAEPHAKPSDEVVEFVSQSLIHPVAAVAKLALTRLLQSPTSPAARRFAEAAVEDMDTFTANALSNDPLRALTRLAEVTALLKEDKS